jgi:PQQ-like domain
LGKSAPLQGNGVVLAEDGSQLYVTASNGNLHIIDAESGQVLKTVRPVLPNNDGDDDDQPMIIRCHSSVAVGDAFVVYAITQEVDTGAKTIDEIKTTTPSKNATASVPTTTSRVVAVDRATLAVTWISDPLDGALAGIPVVSSDSRHIFLTRNADTAAYFTILDSKRGDIILDESSLDINVLSNHLYGPVSIIARHNNVSSSSTNTTNTTTTNMQPYLGGEVNNTNDIIVWHSGGSGKNEPTQGETQLFQFPMSNNNNNSESSDTGDRPRLRSHQLGSRTWTVAAAPVLVNNDDDDDDSSGTNLYLGTSEGRIRGWQDDRAFELTPNYDLPVRNGDVPTWLALRTDRFYVATSDSYFFVMNKTSRAVLWEFPYNTTTTTTTTKNETIVAPPVLSDDGQRVYIARGNRLYCKNAFTGADLWTVPVSGPVDGSAIVAHFAVHGMFLYYIGAERSMVSALRIADVAGPTARPSGAPSRSPTASPAPVIPKPMKIPRPDSVAKASGNAKTVIILSVGAIVAVLLLGIFLFAAKKKLLVGKSNDDDGVDTDYDFGRQPQSQHSRSQPPPPISTTGQPHHHHRTPVMEGPRHPGRPRGAPAFPKHPMPQPQQQRQHQGQQHHTAPGPMRMAATTTAAVVPRVPTTTAAGRDDRPPAPRGQPPPPPPVAVSPTPPMIQKPIRYKYDPTKV